jgi:tetratricopeptide (TPR) repeat protein
MTLDPHNAGAYYIRGCAFEKLGQVDQSIEDFTTVLSIDPNHINAAYARGACENKRGNFAKAIEDYHMALEKDQDRPTSPGGSRKIKVRNMKYILDMPMIGVVNGMNPLENSN